MISHFVCVWRGLILLAVLPAGIIVAGSGEGATTQGISSTGIYRPFLGNSVFNFYGNNGDGSYNPYSSDNQGFEFPAGSKRHLIFEDGVIWGGYSKGSVKPLFGGSTYSHGLQAGRILSPGTATTNPLADSPALAKYRVYSVRRGVTPHTVRSTVQTLLDADSALLARYSMSTTNEIYQAYLQDWMEWPATDGAPYQDVNHDGVYDPATDIPGVRGADQTLWYVANDMSSALTVNLANSMPIGIEFQKTIYGAAAQGAIGSCIFSVDRIINKSGARIDSMYIGQWCDPDIGASEDDLVGCDTLLNLGFAYNGVSSDATFGTNVPAVGQMLLQGPIVPGAVTDTARFGGQLRPGFKNMPMTGFVFSYHGSPLYPSPVRDSGAVIWYRLMQGRNGLNGQATVNPSTGLPSKFCFSGDPVVGTGWVDGVMYPPGDRQMAMFAGPLTMAAGDTQEIVVATFAAQGASPLNSVGLVKSYVPRIGSMLGNAVIAGIAEIDTLYPTHVPITLAGSATTFGPTVPALQWLFISKPPASTAQLVALDSLHVRITPDTPGVYRIMLIASVGDSVRDTAAVDLHVVSVQKPVPGFSVSAVVTLGDTVMLDGSASHDLNGLPLAMRWEVEGSRGLTVSTPYDTLSGSLVSPDSVTAKFVPLRAALHTVHLTVDNGYFSASLTKNFEVTPRASGNISLLARHASSSLPWYDAPGFIALGYYGWSIKEIDGNIWINDGGACAKMNFQNYSLPQEIFNMCGIAFDGGQNYLVAIQSITVFVLRSDGSGHVQSQGIIQPFSRITADTSVRGVMFRKPYVLLSTLKPGIVVYNVSNPASATKVSQYANGELWSAMAASGDLLYAVHPATRKVSVVNISNPASIVNVGTIQLNRERICSNIAKVGGYFFLTEASIGTDYLTNGVDSIAIYDFSNTAQPLLKGFIGVPKTFNPYNRFNAIGGYGKMLMTSTSEGIYLFDVTNPALPVNAGSYLTGSYCGSVFMNASHMLATNYNRVGEGAEQYSYEGLLELQTPFTSVEGELTVAVPEAFRLSQNYPNPFNPSTTIKYELPKSSEVRLSVYDVLGREVCMLVDEKKEPGSYEVKFDGSSLSSGVYFYRIEAGSYGETRKLLLIR